ncbi:MAG: hypothetical protein AABX32_06600 [Nanoarchaeota archaeon]
MKKHICHVAALLIFSVLLLVSCTPSTPKKSGVIGNPDLIKEIIHIERLSIPDDNGNSNLTADDLQRLWELAKDDKTAEDYTTEINWLVAHNQSEHLLHVTSFMREYINTGKDTPCIPHELWHISLYIKYGDLDYAKDEVKSLDEKYNDWVKNVEAKRKVYPQYYTTLADLEQKSKDAIAKLKQGDYSNETLNQLDLIGEYGVC